jgi:glycosyltransferase involved in cell wall biosynthesis
LKVLIKNIIEDTQQISRCDSFIKIYHIVKKYIQNSDNLTIDIPNNLSINAYLEHLEMKLNTTNLEISGVIMVKNQEQYIHNCISSVLPIVDELIVMDTGSTDRTLEIVKSFEDEKICIKEDAWKEDFAFMRNKLVSYSSHNWIFVVDADEVVSTIENPDELKKVLLFLDLIYGQKKDIKLKIEAHYPNSNRYVLPDRIFKKTNSVVFINAIHEELISKNDIMLNLVSTIKFTNYGTTLEEDKKFNKKCRYGNLLLKMLKNDYSNPRWIVLSTNELIKEAYPDLNFEEILITHIKKDLTLPINDVNLQKHEYVFQIMEKLIVYYINQNRFVEAKNLISFCRIKSPYNVNLIAYEYSNKLNKINDFIEEIFKSFIFDVNTLDSKQVKFSSQKDEQILEALGVKYLIKLGRYEEAANYSKNITDDLARDLILDELILINNKL